MDDALYERVSRFTIEQLWEPKGGITAETRLAADIGIAGLDGKEFMEAYAQEFDVDITGFDWVDYFGPEGSGCLWLLPFARCLNICAPHDSARWGHSAADFEICIRDLSEWAAAGAWTPPHTRDPTANKTDAGSRAYGICRGIDASARRRLNRNIRPRTKPTNE